MRTLIWCAVVLLGTGFSARAANDRPNILFAFVDDWGRHAGIYAQIDGAGTANDLIRTPHFDRLARQGVLFRQAFITAPSCTPSRGGLLTGQHFWRAGRSAILRGAIWDPAMPSFPLILKRAGYHIGETYKVWSPGTPIDAPYGAPDHSYEEAGRRFNQFSQNVTEMMAAGRSMESSKQELYDEVLANFEDFLAARGSGQPFCYWFGPTNVHRKWIRGSGKRLWGLDPDLLKGKMPAFLPDVPEIREDLADYFGEIQAFDHALGLLMKKLEEIGELDNTLVVVSGDHGAPGFTHGKCNLYDFGTRVPLAVQWTGASGGRVVDDLTSLTDLAPTFLEAAGIDPPPSMTGRSLLPLLKSDRSGQIDPKRTWILTGRERHVESARDGYLPYPQRAIRTQDYLYIINFKPDRWPMGNPYLLDGADSPNQTQLIEDTRITLQDMDAGPTKAWLVAHRNDPEWKRYYDLAFAKRPEEELYILGDDPHQVRNVAADPKYARLRAELRGRLMRELERTGDPRLKEGGKYFETPPLAGPIVE